MNWKLGLGVVAIGVAGFVAGQTFTVGNEATAAQPEKKATPPGKEAAGMEAMAQVKPGEEHKKLQALIGEFSGSVKMWMTPGSEPMESKGTVKREWAMDGLFLLEHVSGDSMIPGAPAFKGMGIVGYNTYEKRYESVWIENMSTPIVTGTGSFDAGKNTFGFASECYDPMSGKKMETRSVIDKSNPDKEVMTGYSTGPDGKEYKSFEGTFERKK